MVLPNSLRFWFNTDIKLNIPLTALCSYDSKYAKETILDYPTFFIKELFDDKYDSEYNLVEETIYIRILHISDLKGISY